MAKDPAMLWYWGDWNSGTTLMSRFLKGCYIDVLHAHFNNGRLSIEEIKICLGSDFGQSWLTLQKKFKQDENGLFFNERLELEKEKRTTFSKSRRANINKRYEKSTLVDTSVVHMNIHMENENENCIRIIKEESENLKFNTMPSEIDVGELPSIKIYSVIELMKITKQVDVSDKNVIGMWGVFKVQNLTGKKYYETVDDVYSHFINWIKTQNFTNSASVDVHETKNISNTVAMIERAQRLKKNK